MLLSLSSRLPYRKLVGGIQAIAKEDYIKMNGYSNKFYGWGGEDDDLYERMVASGMRVRRPKMEIGRYKMNKRYHNRHSEKSNANRYLLGKFRPRSSLDGLNRIKYLKYNVNISMKPLYTLISINLLR